MLFAILQLFMDSDISVSETILKEYIFIAWICSFLINWSVLINWEYALTHFKPFDFKTTVFTLFYPVLLFFEVFKDNVFLRFIPKNKVRA